MRHLSDTHPSCELGAVMQAQLGRQARQCLRSCTDIMTMPMLGATANTVGSVVVRVLAVRVNSLLGLKLVWTRPMLNKLLASASSRPSRLLCLPRVTHLTQVSKQAFGQFTKQSKKFFGRAFGQVSTQIPTQGVALVDLGGVRRFVLAISVLVSLGVGVSAHATDVLSSMTTQSAPLDLSGVTADPYELALMQVLGEICPPLLNSAQRQKFMNAYQTQLRSFMPANLNANAALRQIGNQRSYRNVLQNVRTWTLSYPVSENKALCVEFAETPH